MRSVYQDVLMGTMDNVVVHLQHIELIHLSHPIPNSLNSVKKSMSFVTESHARSIIKLSLPSSFERKPFWVSFYRQRKKSCDWNEIPQSVHFFPKCFMNKEKIVSLGVFESSVSSENYSQKRSINCYVNICHLNWVIKEIRYQ